MEGGIRRAGGNCQRFVVNSMEWLLTFGQQPNNCTQDESSRAEQASQLSVQFVQIWQWSRAQIHKERKGGLFQGTQANLIVCFLRRISWKWTISSAVLYCPISASHRSYWGIWKWNTSLLGALLMVHKKRFIMFRLLRATVLRRYNLLKSAFL